MLRPPAHRMPCMAQASRDPPLLRHVSHGARRPFWRASDSNDSWLRPLLDLATYSAQRGRIWMIKINWPAMWQTVARSRGTAQTCRQGTGPNRLMNVVGTTCSLGLSVFSRSRPRCPGQSGDLSAEFLENLQHRRTTGVVRRRSLQPGFQQLFIVQPRYIDLALVLQNEDELQPTLRYERILRANAR